MLVGCALFGFFVPFAPCGIRVFETSNFGHAPLFFFHIPSFFVSILVYALCVVLVVVLVFFLCLTSSKGTPKQDAAAFIWVLG